MHYGRANVVDTLPLRLTSLPTGGVALAVAAVYRRRYRRNLKIRHGNPLHRDRGAHDSGAGWCLVQFVQGVSGRTVPAVVLGSADAVLIANFSDKLLFAMHSAPEINSLQDLKGKAVGVSGIGVSTDFATRLAPRDAGIAPTKTLLSAHQDRHG